MFFEPVTIVQMNSSGRSLLQSLQDITTPVPDLIVREAIQNSTDAVKCGVEKVIVDFSLGSFKSKDLSVHLDSIQDKLDEYYSDEEYNLRIHTFCALWSLRDIQFESIVEFFDY